MMMEERENREGARTSDQEPQAKKLEAVGWGLFFIWLGIALFARLGTVVAIMGIGIVILAMQAVRKFYGLALEGFWVVAGLLFLAGGIWDLSGVKAPIGPVILIIIGIVIMARIVFGRKQAAPAPDEPEGGTPPREAGRAE